MRMNYIDIENGSASLEQSRLEYEQQWEWRELERRQELIRMMYTAPSYRIAQWRAFGSPPVIDRQPRDVNAPAGGDTSFTVAATGGELAYQWRKNRVEIEESPHFVGVTSNALTIVAVTADDAGEYDVVVSNHCGAIQSVSASLTVATACQADLFPVGSGDGVVGPGDLGQLLASWGPCRAPCPADLFPVGAGDGTVGPGDLGQLHSQWGQCN